MSQHRPPIVEMQFVMHELAGQDDIAGLPGYDEASPETVAAILEEAGKPRSQPAVRRRGVTTPGEIS